MRRLNLVHQFMLASLVIVVVGMLGIGWWVGQQIQAGVVNRTAATTALYVDSFVAPELQELGPEASLAPDHVTRLDGLLQHTPLGQHIVAFKIWDLEGRILYSPSAAMRGQGTTVIACLALDASEGVHDA